ncbi:MAG: extracellular solute-binding protein [Clostridia bacterium]|nr:extracellular solute-binding protein [Clostridia bacterium]
MKKVWSLILALALLLTMVSIVPAATAEEIFRYDEPITLKVSVFDRGNTGGTAVDNNHWSKWIQENFGDPRNIKIEWVVIPRSEEEAKLATLMMDEASCPDICFTYNESIVTDYVNQGGVIEVSDLIEKYGQTLKSFLGDEVLEFGKFSGGQYAIPARRVVVAWMGMFLRSDWLAKLGREMPTTKEEFLDDLRAFRDQNPGNVEGGCIPYALGKDLRYQMPLQWSFFKDLSTRTLACEPAVAHEGYEDFLLFLNTLYNEGLVSPDFALNNDEALWAEVTSGKAGGYTGNYDHPIRVSPGILASLQAYEPEAMLRPLDCFESVTDSSKYYHPVYAAAGLLNFIPVYSQHPEAAIMYLDWLCQYDTIYYLQNGIDGITSDLNEDGIPVVKDVDEEHHDMVYNSMQNIDYTLLVNGQWLDTPEKTMKSQALSYQGYADLFEEEYIVGNRDSILGGFHFDVPLENNSKYSTTLASYEQEILVKCTMAASAEECSALYKEMLQQYMDMGGKAVMEEKFAAWDAAHAE